MNQYNVGDIINYATWTREVRKVLVIVKEDDIKNGKPGFSGLELGADDIPISPGREVWGYNDQITGRFPANNPCKVKNL